MSLSAFLFYHNFDKIVQPRADAATQGVRWRMEYVSRLLLFLALRTFANILVSVLLHFVLPTMSSSYRAVSNIKSMLNCCFCGRSKHEEEEGDCRLSNKKTRKVGGAAAAAAAAMLAATTAAAAISSNDPKTPRQGQHCGQVSPRNGRNNSSGSRDVCPCSTDPPRGLSAQSASSTRCKYPLRPRQQPNRRQEHRELHKRLKMYYEFRPVGGKLECIPEGDEEWTPISPQNSILDIFDDSIQEIQEVQEIQETGAGAKGSGDSTGTQEAHGDGTRSSSARWERLSGAAGKALRSRAARAKIGRKKSGPNVARRLKSWWARGKGVSLYKELSDSNGMDVMDDDKSDKSVYSTGTTGTVDNDSKEENSYVHAGFAIDSWAEGTASAGNDLAHGERKEGTRPNTTTSRRGSGDAASTDSATDGEAFCSGASGLRKSTNGLNAFLTPLKRKSPRFSRKDTGRL